MKLFKRKTKREKIWAIVSKMEIAEQEGCVEWLVEQLIPEKHLKYLPGYKP